MNKYKISNPDHTPTLQDERVPNAQEVIELFARSSMRSSVMISLMSKSGLRLEVLGNHGVDGLQMQDLPDIVIQQGMARCIRTPYMVIGDPIAL